MNKAVKGLVFKLNKMSKPIISKTDIMNIATIAANNDEMIGDLLAVSFEKVGIDGAFRVEEAKSVDTHLVIVEGMQIDQGYVSPHFVTNTERREVVLDDALILLHDKNIITLDEVLPLFEIVDQIGKSLLVIAEDIEGEALEAFVRNNQRGALQIAATKAPGFGDHRKAMLEDIAILTGGRVVSEQAGIKLENVALSDLGAARRVIMGKDFTTIVEGAGHSEAIKERIIQIRKLIDYTSSDYDREKLQERLAKIAGGVAVILTGGETQGEIRERKMIAEKALYACQMAVQEGMIQGGGIAYLRAIKSLDQIDLEENEAYCLTILREALNEPIRQIIRNAGLQESEVLSKLKNMSDQNGYNVDSDNYVDMFEAGIVDPTKAICTALENAISLVLQLLSGQILDINSEFDNNSLK